MRTAGLTFALGIGAFVVVVSQGCGSRTPLDSLNGVYSEGGPEPEGAPPNSCGNGSCDNGETCTTCALDCGVCPGCGDGQCNDGETCFNCPMDCGVCPTTCGDGKCQMPQENCQNCDVDCGMCPGCGDGKCDPGPPQNETCYSCPQDCGKCMGCGNGICDPNETCASCPQDCGVCDFCGNGKCESPYETCTNCVADCGECPVISCSQELQCALKCINPMSTTPVDFVCIGDCVSQGCPSAGYMVNQVVDCIEMQLLGGGGFGSSSGGSSSSGGGSSGSSGGGGQCQGGISINCLLQACMNQVAACLSQRCPPTQQQDGG